MKLEDRLVQQAREIAKTVESWADLSNALYNPVDGILIVAFPTRADREAFIKTKQYKEIRGLIHAAMDRFGLVEGATPIKSGRFLVRVPRSLHAALEQEAAREGVSLNQLVTTKLASPLSRIVRQPKKPTKRRKAG